MLQTTILILYLASASASTGMTVTTAEFATREACEFAGKQSRAKLGGWGTSAYWVCAPKGEPMPAVPQSR